MPRVRRRRNYGQLGEFESGRFIGLDEAGIGLHEIAKQVETLPLLFVLQKLFRGWGSGREDLNTRG